MAKTNTGVVARAQRCVENLAFRDCTPKATLEISKRSDAVNYFTADVQPQTRRTSSGHLVVPRRVVQDVKVKTVEPRRANTY